MPTPTSPLHQATHIEEPELNRAPLSVLFRLEFEAASLSCTRHQAPLVARLAMTSTKEFRDERAQRPTVTWRARPSGV
ncbi:hypothetical protein AAFF_G00238520 [Aldrovandia affinis]|uniref:Uncharacterized protein n=1 Tax=Aldrovandia affinis TaxID=143900 RepID=A0AAD7W4G4_9TELE|nr:hypothetical protein AAFF_G00238520 [Aldrovandia affinis]